MITADVVSEMPNAGAIGETGRESAACSQNSAAKAFGQ